MRNRNPELLLVTMIVVLLGLVFLGAMVMMSARPPGAVQPFVKSGGLDGGVAVNLGGSKLCSIQAESLSESGAWLRDLLRKYAGGDLYWETCTIETVDGRRYFFNRVASGTGAGVRMRRTSSGDIVVEALRGRKSVSPSMRVEGPRRITLDPPAAVERPSSAQRKLTLLLGHDSSEPVAVLGVEDVRKIAGEEFDDNVADLLTILNRYTAGAGIAHMIVRDYGGQTWKEAHFGTGAQDPCEMSLKYNRAGQWVYTRLGCAGEESLRARDIDSIRVILVGRVDRRHAEK